MFIVFLPISTLRGISELKVNKINKPTGITFPLGTHFTVILQVASNLTSL